MEPLQQLFHAIELDGDTTHQRIAVGQPPISVTMLRHLPLNGVDVDTEDSRGWTLLSWACQCRNVAAARYLLSRGAAPNQPAPFDDCTPLARVLKDENVDEPRREELVALLLAAGADVDARVTRFDCWWTPLAMAAGPPPVKKLVGLGVFISLLRAGARLDDCDYRGRSIERFMEERLFRNIWCGRS